MQIQQTGIEGLIELVPDVFPDDRGWFYEFYKKEHFHELGITQEFVQENISFSKKDVIRGMHMQMTPYAQAKLVGVLQGKVLDVVVDLRQGSPTFGKKYSCTLDGARHNMLYVPEGFVHGFAALEDSIFLYKTSNKYDAASERGILWKDPDLNIAWPVNNPIVSAKDQKLPLLRELLGNSVISR